MKRTIIIIFSLLSVLLLVSCNNTNVNVTMHIKFTTDPYFDYFFTHVIELKRGDKIDYSEYMTETSELVVYKDSTLSSTYSKNKRYREDTEIYVIVDLKKYEETNLNSGYPFVNVANPKVGVFKKYYNMALSVRNNPNSAMGYEDTKDYNTYVLFMGFYAHIVTADQITYDDIKECMQHYSAEVYHEKPYNEITFKDLNFIIDDKAMEEPLTLLKNGESESYGIYPCETSTYNQYK